MNSMLVVNAYYSSFPENVDADTFQNQECMRVEGKVAKVSARVVQSGIERYRPRKKTCIKRNLVDVFQV